METSVQLWLLIGLCFTVYFITSYIYKIVGIDNLKSAVLSKNGIRLINLKHSIGILLFGGFVVMIPGSLDLLLRFNLPSIDIFFLFIVALILTAYVSYRFFKNFKLENERTKKFLLKFSGNYILIRIMFLLLYEFFFRGILLYSFLEVTSPFLSIVLCTALYLLIHCFDSKAEFLGALPFGVILCLFTYYTNNIWMAFYIHVTLSMVYEFSLLQHFKLKNQKS